MTVKEMLPRSLLGRSLLIIVTPLILVQLVSAYIFYDRHWTTVTRRMSDALAGDISAVVSLLRRERSPQGQDWVIDLAAEKFALTVAVTGQEFVAETEEPADALEAILARSIRQSVALPFAIDLDLPDRMVGVRVRMVDSTLSFTFDRKRLASTTVQILSLWMVGTGLTVAVVAIMFMRNQIRPIHRLAHAAEEFGKGREVAHFRPAGATEVRQAAAAFLSMRERIRRQIAQRTEMLAGVSHDLRTPLTRMKLQLAMMGETAEIAELKADVDEMERMVDGYLAFARGEGTEQPRSTEVAALLQEVVRGARRNGTPIDLHVEGEVELPLRSDAFRRSIANLVNNAARHGHQVAVRAGVRGRALEITVDDDGPGIAPEHREEVFRPFFRLDPSRNAETGGTGLGLTIARDVIRGHGGDLTLEDSPIGGLRARVRVPL